MCVCVGTLLSLLHIFHYLFAYCLPEGLPSHYMRVSGDVVYRWNALLLMGMDLLRCITASSFR